MSTTSAVGPVTITGIGSGLNTNSMIEALTNAQTQAVTGYQNQETTLNTELSAWQGINADLLSLQTQAAGLTSSSAFNSATATAGDSTIVSATAQAGATQGNHTLDVTQLASAQKIMTQSFGSANTPLGFTGSFVLNGQTISVSSTDTLSSLVAKINGVNSGVTAAIVDAGTGSVLMTLTANNSGTANAISASDSSGSTALESLGLVPSTKQTTTLRDSLTPSGGGSGAGSIGFSSATATVGSLLGGSTGSAPSGTVTINGVDVDVNLNTMSLTDVANAINQAGISGVTAQVVALPTSSGSTGAGSQQQLQITGAAGAITSSSFSDPNGILSTLGITQTGFSNVVSAAADAQFTLDGVQMTRSSNTVNDALTGVSLNLLSTGSTTVDVSQNTSNVVSSINSFVSAYNQVINDINNQFQFTPPSGGADSTTSTTAPPLFGSFTLTEIQSELASALNVTAGGTALGNIGITTNSDGTLSVNTSTLTNALQSNPTQVANLFGLTGSATNSDVTFVSGTGNTEPSPTGGYAVNITQAATEATVTAGTAQTSPLAQAETLTFAGSLFSAAGVSISLPQNSTLAQVVSLINGDSNLNQSIFASINSSGELQLSSTGYGSANQFTVSSNVAAGASSTGIGTTTLSGAGQDVAGTINGEPATGLGQTLTGNSGNANTSGLQLLVTATAPGSYGTVSVVSGLADQINNLANQITDPTSGAIITAENSINTQVTQVQQQITNTQNQLAAYTAYLQQEFASMDTALAQLQSQSSALAAEVGSTANLQGSSSTSSSSSSSSGGLSSGTTNTSG